MFIRTIKIKVIFHIAKLYKIYK